MLKKALEKRPGFLISSVTHLAFPHSLKVAAEFRLVSDTLYAAVAFVDRVLSVRRVERPRLQLVGVAATLVAAK